MTEDTHAPDEVKIASLAEIQPGLNRINEDGVELVVVKKDDALFVFSGICLHAEALLANGFLDGEFLTCGSHLWRYNLSSGELDGEPGIYLKKLQLSIRDQAIYVLKKEIEELRDDDDWS